MSHIQFRDTIQKCTSYLTGLQNAKRYIINITILIAYTMEPLYCGQHWDKYKCPDYRGVLISGVNLYYKAQFGTFLRVLNTGVSSFQGVLNRGVSLYNIFLVFILRNCVLPNLIKFTCLGFSLVY